MTLSREAFRDLEDAVGIGNLSDDPSTCLSYGWLAGLGGVPKAEKIAPNQPVGVALPGSTEEVQRLVKACIRHGISIKPHSTGYGSFGTSMAPNCLAVDLRRMNRIHHLDGRNQMAIIEPYVTAGQLQAEAMKKGLNCHIVGAGLTHSPFASATACFGIGITGASTGNNARNLLGVEWVSPEGEIVRIGAPGAESGWFTDEGPGPGFRGMIRGLSGTFGELGVFTRIGYKLYPWKGPKELTRTGVHPQTGMEVPDHFSLHHVVWDSWESLTAASYDLNRSAIADVMVRIPPNSWAIALTRTNNEMFELLTAADIPEIARDTDACRCTWTLLLAGASAAEARYKQRVLDDILGRTGGRTMQLTPEQHEIATQFLISSHYVPRVIRPTAALTTSFGVMDSFRLLPGAMAAGEECMGEDIKPGGNFMAGAREEFWSWPTERRHLWTENAYSYNRETAAGRGAVFRYMVEHGNTVDQRGTLGIDAFVTGPLADFFGLARSGTTRWLRKIKARFDPHRLQDGLIYIGRQPSPVIPVWPLARAVLFLRPFRPFFKWMMSYFAANGLPGAPRPRKRPRG